MPLTHLTFVQTPKTISNMHMHIISDIKQFDNCLNPKTISDMHMHIISDIKQFDIGPNPQPL